MWINFSVPKEGCSENTSDGLGYIDRSSRDGERTPQKSAVTRPYPLKGKAAARGGSRVLIIDSQEGHVWTWSGNELIADSGSGRRYGAAFIYQGKVRPGSKTGEIIDVQPK